MSKIVSIDVPEWALRDDFVLRAYLRCEWPRMPLSSDMAVAVQCRFFDRAVGDRIKMVMREIMGLKEQSDAETATI